MRSKRGTGPGSCGRRLPFVEGRVSRRLRPRRPKKPLKDPRRLLRPRRLRYPYHHRLGLESRSGARGGVINNRGRALSRRRMSCSTRSSTSPARRAARFERLKVSFSLVCRSTCCRKPSTCSDCRRCSVSYCADNLSKAAVSCLPSRSYSSPALSIASRQADRAWFRADCPACRTAGPRTEPPRSPAASRPRVVSSISAPYVTRRGVARFRRFPAQVEPETGRASTATAFALGIM